MPSLSRAAVYGCATIRSRRGRSALRTRAKMRSTRPLEGSLISAGPLLSVGLQSCVARSAQIAGERQRANPLPGRGKDGIGDCRRQGRGSRLTDAAPFRRISIARARVDDLDARHFIHSKGAIVVEIGLLNLTLLQSDLAMQRGYQPVRHRAFHLCFHNTRVHQIAGVDGAYYAMNRDLPGARDR